MAQSIPKFDKSYSQGTAAATGGTFIADYPVPIDTTVLLKVYCMVSIASGGHQTSTAVLYAEYVVENKNGTLSAPTALTNSVNPGNSNTTTFVAAHAMASDYLATGLVTLTMSISTTNARATYTNVGNPSTANVTIYFEAIVCGST